MTEQWKDIPGYDDFEVSSHGKVRTKTRTVKANGDGQWRNIASREIKLQHGWGCLNVSLRRDGRDTTRSIKRLVWEAFGGSDVSSSDKITNIDGNLENNRIDNLEIKKYNPANKNRNKYERERVAKKKAKVYVHPTIGDIYGCAKIGNRLLRMKW